jgi:hypothetical protein
MLMRNSERKWFRAMVENVMKLVNEGVE